MFICDPADTIYKDFRDNSAKYIGDPKFPYIKNKEMVKNLRKKFSNSQTAKMHIQNSKIVKKTNTCNSLYVSLELL